MMIKGFAHVCLAAVDLPAAERFYCSGLGFRKIFDFIRNKRVIGFYLEISQGDYVEIFQRDEIDAKAKGPIQHFCLEVDDIEQVRLRLSENGYEATGKTLGADQSWQIWTTDPSGVRIEFHQYTDRSSQVTHENCILE
jgi:lactoylglutathione lyase/glyoxylase I family protein